MIRTPRRLRRWHVAGIVLILAVAATAAVPFLVPVDRYRGLSEGYIHSTGKFR